MFPDGPLKLPLSQFTGACEVATTVRVITPPSKSMDGVALALTITGGPLVSEFVTVTLTGLGQAADVSCERFRTLRLLNEYVPLGA